MALSWLFFWRRRAAKTPHLRVRLYTRAGCHLCDDAWTTLQDTQGRWGFTLDVVDVDSDLKLVGLYGEWVPVVTVDERVRFRGKLNPVLLERLLRAASAQASKN
jgi:glutaredoxin